MGKTNEYKRDMLFGVRHAYFLLLIAYCVLFFSLRAEAAVAIGQFALVEGRVDVLRTGALPAVAVKAGDPVFIKDVVRTKSGARAEVAFSDGNVVKIAQRSRVDISEYMPDKGVLSLARGKVEAIVQKKGPSRVAFSPEAIRFEVRTPNAVAGVRGTDFFVYHVMNTTGVVVKEGSVYTYNPEFPRKVVIVPAGSITTVLEKRSPQLPRPASSSEIKKHEGDVGPGKPVGKSENKPAEKQAGNSPGGGTPVASGTTTVASNAAPPASATTPATALPDDTTSLAAATPDMSSSPDAQPSDGVANPDAQTDEQAPPADSVDTPPITETVDTTNYPYYTAVSAVTGPTSSAGSAAGTIDAFLGISQPPWDGAEGVPISLIGSYNPGPNANSVWLSNTAGNSFFSFNDKDSTLTTHDGGAFCGYMGGRIAGAAMDGKIYALYIDPNGNAGYLLGNLSGDIDATTNSLLLNGSLQSVPIESVLTLPGDLVSVALDSKVDRSSGMISNVSFNSTSMSNYNYSLETMSIGPSADWGIWLGTHSGSFQSTTGNTPGMPADNWTAEIVSYAPDYSKYIARWTAGDTWSSGLIHGTTTGFWADISGGGAATGIAVGETLGTFDPAAATFQAIQMGVWMNTNKFLDMLASQPETLQKLNIPSVEVGRVNLAGSYKGAGAIAVEMDDVIFVAPAGGARPQLWATGNVNGSYADGYSYKDVAVPVSGGGVSGVFTPKNWDPANGKWLATVDGNVPAATLSGYNGPAAAFKGAAAGAINTGAKTFCGTAAGYVK